MHLASWFDFVATGGKVIQNRNAIVLTHSGTVLPSFFLHSTVIILKEKKIKGKTGIMDNIVAHISFLYPSGPTRYGVTIFWRSERTVFFKKSNIDCNIRK